MKKILLLMTILFLVFGFISCGRKNKQDDDNPVDNPGEVIEPVDNDPYKKRDVDYPKEIAYNNEDSIAIHYKRSDNKYLAWCLWLWDPTGVDDGDEDSFNYQDEFGVIAYYPLSYFGAISSGKLGIIIKRVGTWTKDGTESDRFIDFSVLEKDEHNVYHVYFFGGDGGVYSNKDKSVPDAVTTAQFNNFEEILIKASNTISEIKLYKGEELIDTKTDVERSSYTYHLNNKVDLTKNYKVSVTFKASGATITRSVAVNKLYNTDEYNELFYYDGNLGVLYDTHETTFNVWSPVSDSIKLRIYDNGTPTSVDSTIGDDTYTEHNMNKMEKGVFTVTVSGDLAGKYYTYVVYNPDHPNGVEIVDPYAKGAGVNGLRGMIVNFAQTDPSGWDEINPLEYDRKKLVVWETHVADVTSSSTWTGTENNRRRYLGLVESGTTYTAGLKTVTTGFDHIKELGVNAVQLIPVFDQANDETKYTFNWGYNPLNYNVVEGMYSSNPYDGYVRIRELKTVIQEFNKAGISTIMDVVYNHVNGAANSNFDILMPNYYFRYNSDGTLSNGSGCGNEVASENKMVRKFIVDSCKFWAEEYKLGGFRFDLMGLIDMQTMKEVVEACEEVNPNIVIYGEPWQGGSSPLAASEAATQANGYLYEGYGQFNDQMRDALIKGGLNDASSKGWVNNTSTIFASDIARIKAGINGSTYLSRNSIEDPNKNVIYATCHDNYTLFDRLKAAGTSDTETIKKMAMLANSVVLTSSGTSFILAGEEFLRTKQGNNNSYNAPDSINQLNYALKISHNDMFENYKKLIEFKKNCSALHLDEPNIEVTSLNNGSILYYTLECSGASYIVIHSNGLNDKSAIDTTGYSVLLDTLGVLEGSLDEVTPSKYQTIIMEKTN